MSIEEIKGEALRRFAPSGEEEREIYSLAEELVRRLRERIPEGEPVLVGSVAKRTFLKDADIDIFVLFEPGRYDKEEMGRILWERTEGILEERRMEFAEHPYVRGRAKGRDVDVVPCYRVPSATSIISAVDRTPFHTEYVRGRISVRQRNEVRVLKAFAKGIGVYGSDLRTMGFSGYLLELLVLEYGSFEGVLEAATTWGSRALLPRGKEGEARKFRERMVFLDPTDPNRNAAAAVSDTNYGIFVLAARDFLRRPSMDFFTPPPKEPGKAERETHFVELRIPRPGVVDDVLYPQVRKAVSAITKWLRRMGFGPVDAAFIVDDEKVRILIEVERIELPAVERHMGPPLWHERALDFMDKWAGNEETMRGPYPEGGRLWVDRKRKIRRVEEAILECAQKASFGANLDEVKEEIELIVDSPSADLLKHFLSIKLRWIK